jgi:uncharacterized membrane protein
MIPKKYKKLPILHTSYGLLIIIIVYTAFFAAYSLQKHAAFQTAGFDLGIWDQKVWNILHGRPFIITTQGSVEISLGDHVDPIIGLLLAPLYSLYSAPQTLIIVQVLLVSLGALPIYWLAQSKLRSELAGLIFAVVYLLFPALEGAITFDFHGLTVVAPLLTYALWAMNQRYYRLFLVMAILAMVCQEDVPLLTLMMGLYIVGIQQNWRVGSVTVAGSLLWFALANFLIIPTFSLGGDNIHLYRYEALGDDFSQVIITVLTRPDLVVQQVFAGEKRFYWIRLTVPTAFTALLDPFILLLALPSLLINTLSTYPPTYQLDLYHSSSAIVPFVTVASINGLARLIKFAEPKFQHVSPSFLRNALLVMVLLGTLAYQVQFGHTPMGRYFEWPTVTEHHYKAEAMLAQIPPQAAVAAQNNLVPRLSQRQWIFILPKLSHRDKQADYIALDMRGSLNPYHFIEEYCAQISEFLASPDYGLIFADDGLLLFERNAPDIATFEPMSPCL